MLNDISLKDALEAERARSRRLVAVAIVSILLAVACLVAMLDMASP